MSCCRAVAAAEGLAFWSSPSLYDEAVRLSTGALEDEDKAVADAFAAVLGELAAGSHSPAARTAVRESLGLFWSDSCLGQAIQISQPYKRPTSIRHAQTCQRLRSGCAQHSTLAGQGFGEEGQQESCLGGASEGDVCHMLGDTVHRSRYSRQEAVLHSSDAVVGDLHQPPAGELAQPLACSHD